MRRIFKSEVFQYKQYRLFLTSSLLNFIAFNIQNLARSWLMAELSNSPFLIALVPAVAFTPVLVLSIFGGVIADNFNRKVVVLISDVLFLANVSALIVLVATGVVQPWHVLTASAISGTLFALSGSSRQTMQSLILPHDLFRRAASTYAVFFNIAVFIAPLISTLTLPLLGVVGTMATALTVKTLATIVTLFIHLRSVVHHRVTLRSVRTDIAQGVKFSIHDIDLRALLLLLAVVVVSVGSYRAILPVFATDVFNLDEIGFTLLNLFAGIGAILGAIVIAVAFNKVDYHKHHGFVWGLLACGSLIGFGLSPVFWLACIFIVVLGLSLASFLAFNVSTITEIAPDDMRGRIMSFRGILIGTTPVGSISLGALAENWGAPTATWIIALVGLVGLAIIFIAERYGKTLRLSRGKDRE